MAPQIDCLYLATGRDTLTYNLKSVVSSENRIYSHYAGLLIAPAEGFGLRTRLIFGPFGQKALFPDEKHL